MGGQIEDVSVKKGLAVNSTIELGTISLHDLATKLSQSCPEGAGIFASWLASIITDEQEKIHRDTGLGIIIDLIDVFSRIEDATPFENLMNGIKSGRWIGKLTNKQKFILIKSIMDRDKSNGVPDPNDAAGAILIKCYKLSIPYAISKLDKLKRA